MADNKEVEIFVTGLSCVVSCQDTGAEADRGGSAYPALEEQGQRS